MTTAATVLDQAPVPYGLPEGELLLQSVAVPGGTLYIAALREPGLNGAVVGIAEAFVPAAQGGATRYLKLSDAKSDLGVPLTAAAGTPTGAVGLARTAGSSFTLAGEATSANAKTDKALFEFNLPDSYVAGANIAVTVNCNTSSTTDVTAASTTMTVAAYTEIAGAEAALTVSAAQQIPGVAANLVFTVTGAGLAPGAHVALELVMLVTTTSGGTANGVINSVSYVA